MPQPRGRLPPPRHLPRGWGTPATHGVLLLLLLFLVGGVPLAFPCARPAAALRVEVGPASPARDAAPIGDAPAPPSHELSFHLNDEEAHSPTSTTSKPLGERRLRGHKPNAAPVGTPTPPPSQGHDIHENLYYHIYYDGPTEYETLPAHPRGWTQLSFNTPVRVSMQGNASTYWFRAVKGEAYVVVLQNPEGSKPDERGFAVSITANATGYFRGKVERSMYATLFNLRTLTQKCASQSKYKTQATVSTVGTSMPLATSTPALGKSTDLGCNAVVIPASVLPYLATNATLRHGGHRYVDVTLQFPFRTHGWDYTVPKNTAIELVGIDGIVPYDQSFVPDGLAHGRRYKNRDYGGVNWWSLRFPGAELKPQTFVLLTIPRVHGKPLDPAAAHGVVRVAIPKATHVPMKVGTKVTCNVAMPGDLCTYSVPIPAKYEGRLFVAHVDFPKESLATFEYQPGYDLGINDFYTGLTVRTGPYSEVGAHEYEGRSGTTWLGFGYENGYYFGREYEGGISFRNVVAPIPDTGSVTVRIGEVGNLAEGRVTLTTSTSHLAVKNLSATELGSSASGGGAGWRFQVSGDFPAHTAFSTHQFAFHVPPAVSLNSSSDGSTATTTSWTVTQGLGSTTSNDKPVVFAIVKCPGVDAWLATVLAVANAYKSAEKLQVVGPVTCYALVVLNWFEFPWRHRSETAVSYTVNVDVVPSLSGVP